MTLGELKINCYKLIDPSDEVVVADNITDVYEHDTAYSFYFLNMLNSINSAITRIVQACILPLKKLEIDCKVEYDKTLVSITGEDGTEKIHQPKKKLSINLREYTDDIYKIKLIEYQDKNGNSNKIYYRKIGNFLEATSVSDGNIVIYYYPRLNSIEQYFQAQGNLEDINKLDLSVLELDDSILSIIPYYVKADLLEHDKPTEATLARNVFEQYLSSFEVPEIEVNNEHKSWWRGLI